MPQITYLFTTCSLEKEIYYCHFKELLEQEPTKTTEIYTYFTNSQIEKIKNLILYFLTTEYNKCVYDADKAL